MLRILRQALLLIPLIFLLPMFFGAHALWFSGPISDLASAAVSMAVVVFELRRRRRLREDWCDSSGIDAKRRIA